MPAPTSVQTVYFEFLAKKAAEKNAVLAAPRPRMPFGESTRLGATALGAMTGATLGAPAGLLGVAGGGIIGAMMGRFGGEAMLAGEQAAGLVPKDAPLVRGKQLAGQIVKEGAFEAATMGAGQLVRIVGVSLRPLVRKALKIPLASRTTTQGFMPLARASREIGFELLPIDVSLGRFARGFAEVAGKFPFFGGPMRAAKERQAGQAAEALAGFQEKLGPATSQSQRSKALLASGKASFEKFRADADMLYGEFRRLADATGAMVGTDIPREAAQGVLDTIKTRTPTGQIRTRGRVPAGFATGPAIPPAVKTRPLPIAGEMAKVRDMAGEFAKLSPELTLDQMKGLLARWDDVMKGLKTGEARSLMMNLKKSVDGALDSSLRATPEVLEAKARADLEFAARIKIFETPTAQAFGRIERNVFKTGFKAAGAASVTKLFKMVFDADDPIAMVNLRKLIDDDAVFKQAVAGHFADVITGATKITRQSGVSLDAKKIERSFGLTSVASDRYRTFAQMVQGAGVDPSQVKTFLDAFSLASEVQIGRASQFIARRGTLGGARSVVRAFTPVSPSGQTTVFGAIKKGFANLGAIVGGRAVGRILTDPRMLSLANAAMSEEAGALRANASMIRLGRLLVNELQAQNLDEVAIESIQSVFEPFMNFAGTPEGNVVEMPRP